MPRVLVLAVLAAALVLAGCTGTPKDTPDDADDAVQPMNDAHAPAQTGANMSRPSASTNTSTSANSTASGNSTSQPQYDYSNCMRGMDMEGCPAAVAEKYFNDRAANYTAPPPDKELPNILVALTPNGADQTGAFSIESGTMQLLIDINLNDTGVGPYLALGLTPIDDLQLVLTPSEGEPQTVTIPGQNVGVNPALPLAMLVHTTVSMPTIGDWTLEVVGLGLNAQVDVHIVERFYM